MDSQSLRHTIEFVSGWGVILSPEQKASLQTSLPILLNRQKFTHVQFWGKIIGIQDDYYIAQGYTRDQLSEKRTLYSKDCLHWALLNPPTEDALNKSRHVKGRFTGNPSYEAQVTRLVDSDVEGEDTKKEVLTLKEEERLAAVVADIDREVFVVPRKAYIKSPSGQVYKNRNFEGHTQSEACRLHNYLHLRPAERSLLHDQLTLERADFDNSIDFMDCIESDIPKGCWCVQLDRVTGAVLLKSLLWPGYFFYHVPCTAQYGSVYVGTGEKNIDLPFML